MFRPTRLISAVSTLWAQLNTRLQLTRENISFHLFCLVGGFFLGNIFGTFLNVLRGIFHWDGLIILAFIFLCEFISFQTYRPIAEAKTRATPIRAQDFQTRRAPSLAAARPPSSCWAAPPWPTGTRPWPAQRRRPGTQRSRA